MAITVESVSDLIYAINNGEEFTISPDIEVKKGETIEIDGRVMNVHKGETSIILTERAN
jgi:hypothetical protein